ncbi:pathogenicity island 2 effector protein SseE [Yersinia enterocolitica]|uniref:pathogenicity island 2 effector protein SseE n=1 Tax=Yersinia enterocolitica TaxID=630 RepID=UPI0003D88400|nr:pathogenicity island 2 effector protein SseE [Yersinia enterocolitica]EKN3404214.1 pathogenicity island 2 effector protein SseE [Yersinia enterocolitica]EKN3635553.1 pathogenicity island 2 effector protein SseE [Yersinia enterocolitica]EKN3689354.1 pathogenicity island 2 effector protein SseE [Yersinia enterocolitica]EKN3717428.1 pathogenicity island 2 effector protein SseE [Yersinia enterocolitica]EKN3755780.1 pathogenicity island 2 effector protein SseE [Yersinia enterocolitica]
MRSNSLNIEQYLNDKSCTVKIAYFENSAIKIGHEFCLYGYHVIYRVEDGEFIICYLGSTVESGLPGNFIKLFNFLHHLSMSVVGPSIVRMMVIDNIASPILQSIRHRLIKILIAKGAFSKNIDGDDWLLFDVSEGVI